MTSEIIDLSYAKSPAISGFMAAVIGIAAYFFTVVTND